MTTKAIIRNRIASEIQRTDLSSQIDAAVLSAIAHYEREPFYFTESRAQTFATVASQEFYGSADNSNIPNLAIIETLQLLTGTTLIGLEKKTWDFIDTLSNTTTTTGQPEFWSYFAQQIRLYPIPDAAYTIRIAGTIRATTLSADSDSNNWVIDGEELIRARAKADVEINVEQKDDWLAEARMFGSIGLPYLCALERTAHHALLAESTRRGATGRVRLYQF